MNDINLLPKQNSFSLRQEQMVATLRRVSIIVLAATAFLSVVVFVLVLQSPLSKSQQEEQTLIDTMKQLSTKVSRHIIIQERLASITTVLKGRTSYEKDLQTILSQMPSSITISSLSISSKVMTLSGNSSSVDDINTFLTNIMTLKQKKQLVASAVLKSFVLQSANAKYFFTLQVTFL